MAQNNLTARPYCVFAHGYVECGFHSFSLEAAMLKIGIPKEILPGEKRVSAVPETVTKMVKSGMEVLVEANAGQGSYIEDSDYEKASAKIISDQKSLFHDADVLLKVHRPIYNESLKVHELDLMRKEALLICPLFPMQNPDLVSKIKENQLTAFSLDLLPRIARAQSMDILSSMTNIAGYKSVIMAANHLPKLFPMMTTAAGTILPAKVIVIGAGVAGLQAIATARRLGAQVLAFDTRPVVEEQVKSLGADFVMLEHAKSGEGSEDKSGYAKEQSAEFYQKEQETIQQYLKDADVVITTALIPGKRAPLLITEEMVQEMKPGSVIVDLAIEQQGNCALTESGKIVNKKGVTIIGLLNLPSTLPIHASQLYARNLYAFLNYLLPFLNKGEFDMNDEIIKGCLICQKGEIVHPALHPL